jgi:hypothetical protein
MHSRSMICGITLETADGDSSQQLGIGNSNIYKVGPMKVTYNKRITMH